MPENPSIISVALFLPILSLILLSQTHIVYNSVVDEYSSTFRRADHAFRDLMEDLAGAMEVAEKFKDLNYNYDPRDLDNAINRDGHNGTQELISVFEDLLKITRKFYNLTIEETQRSISSHG